MFIETARTGALMALAAALVTGCATVVPPTSPAELPQVRPGYVVGYLKPMELPDSQALLPPRRCALRARARQA
jgi:hypothetical protein